MRNTTRLFDFWENPGMDGSANGTNGYPANHNEIVDFHLSRLYNIYADVETFSHFLSMPWNSTTGERHSHEEETERKPWLNLPIPLTDS
jgi:hypothetical protein